MAESSSTMNTEDEIMTKPEDAIFIKKCIETEDEDVGATIKEELDKTIDMKYEEVEEKYAKDWLEQDVNEETYIVKTKETVDKEDEIYSKMAEGISRMDTTEEIMTNSADAIIMKKCNETEDVDFQATLKEDLTEKCLAKIREESGEEVVEHYSEWRIGTSERNAQPKEKAHEKEVGDGEAKIGISEYLGSHSGFFGIIKQRYSDFIVNEVTSGGEVVHLTEKIIPPIPDIIPLAPAEHPPELTPGVMEQIDIMVGPPRPARISLVSPHIDSGNASQIAEVSIDVNSVTKVGRTNIHQAVKAKYGTNIISSYKEDADGNKIIVIRRANAVGNIPKRTSWPKTHTYTTFVLYKENIDTIDAINNLAKYTGSGVKANMFAYAGTKDKRGKTSQLVSVPRVAPEKLSNAASIRKCIHVGNFTYQATPQKLGQLRGNKFHIVLREVKGSDEQIMSAIESLKTNGFINYFGSQRFSTSSVSTHFIGRELLKSNWHKAINLILAPRKNEVSLLNECRSVWNETGDADAALKVLRSDRESSIEGKLLKGLKNLQKNDLVGALGLIPRNVRMLYLHAYQSYIWNMVVSRRIKKYGLKVLPGDIIRRKDLPGLNDDDISGNNCDDDNSHNGVDGNGTNNSISNKKKDEENTERKALYISDFHFLSEEEAKTTHIADVLLPLPGYQVAYPINEIKEWYVELLKADELSFSSLKHHVKCYSVGGMYRRLVAHPTDVSSCITYYKDPTSTLILSDLNILNGDSVDENLLQEGPYKAVIIEMTLSSSTYATMALRELLKMDTSSAFQATLNENSGGTKESFSADSRGYSKSGYKKREYHERDRSKGNIHHGKVNKNWHSHSHSHPHSLSHRGEHYQGESHHRDFGSRGRKGKGQKRPRKGSRDRGSKRRRVDLDF